MKGTLYKTVNLLSVDVSLGAIATGYMVSKFFSVSLPFIWWILLGATVWIIYTADHLADSRKAPGQNLSERHSFHYKHFRALCTLVIVFIPIVIVVAMLYMERHILVLGMALGAISLIYLIYSFQFKKYPLPKEFVVAVIYFIGITFGTLTKCYLYNIEAVFFLIALFGIVINNLVLFSIFSKLEDEKAHFDSVVIRLGERSTTSIFYFFVVLSSASSVLLISIAANKWVYCAVLVAMNFTLVAMFFKKEQLKDNSLYRMIGDSVFLLPCLTLFVS